MENGTGFSLKEVVGLMLTNVEKTRCGGTMHKY